MVSTIGPILCTILLFAVVQAAGNGAPNESTPVRQHLLADFGWKFSKGDIQGADKAAFDDRAWRTLNLPHDWSIEGPYSEQEATTGRGGYLPTGIAWYRREFNAPHSWRGKKVFVDFDGVYMRSDVWINGNHLGNRPFGYIGFEYDLTPCLNIGKENVISVRVDNSQQPNSRWYSGSGIDRHVWFTITSPVHIEHWGTYITTPAILSTSATVRIRTQVRNEDGNAQTVVLRSQIVSADGTVVAETSETAEIGAGAGLEFDQSLDIANPALWSLDTPTLYRVHSIVEVGGKPVDDLDTPFGVRTIDYDVNKGFFLNGVHVKMHGMCVHEDGGSVGAAVPEAVWERRLRLLKEMGSNAIRTSHNPPTPEFLDLCDRLGFVVMDESFDEWTQPKVPHGYSTIFAQWSDRDLTDMLKRDRNHPCVVMWSVGNEIGEQTMPTGADVLRPLVETCHQVDPTRPVTAACDNVYTDHGGATLDFLNLLDIVGYNYVDRWGSRRETYYTDDRFQYPTRKFVGTEESTVYSERGVYTFAPMGRDQLVRPNYESAMIGAEGLLKFDTLNAYVIGEFFWTGIDYLGEARWPRKLATSGALDTCGFPKDSYYFFQSQWTTEPMIHLLPPWNWPGREGQVIPVICYTNCSSVELFLNGKSLGVKSLEFPRPGTAGGWNTYAAPPVIPTTSDLHLEWDVPYEPGVVKAVGYRDGKQVCEEDVHTAGAAAAVEMTADRDTLLADGQDVAQLTVKIVDAQGNIVPTAGNLVTFDVKGAGSLIGVDNGDPESHDDYKANGRSAYNGLCFAIVQTARRPGKITISASADGLTTSMVYLTVNRPEAQSPTLP